MENAVMETEFKVSERRVLRRGDWFRVGGGTKHVHGIMPPVRGLFCCREIWSTTSRTGRRVFIDAVEVDERTGLFGAERTFFVSGRPFRKAAIPTARFIPYTIRLYGRQQSKKRSGKR